ncbi:MAG: traSA:integrase fusion protein [Frankiales bacterium]|nr:traSA:integrase fusion protein [Frankiales bacterium]
MAEPRRVTHGRGTSWEITYRVDGRQVRRRFPTKAAASAALARARTEATDGVHIPPVHRKVTLEEYGKLWLTTLQVRPQTRIFYTHYVTKHIVPALGDRQLSSLRRSDIQAFVATLAESHLAPSTVDAIYKIVAMICRSAVYDRRLVTTPCFKIKVPEIPPRALAVFTPAQVRALLSSCKDEHRAVLAVGVGAGLRQAEALGLCASSVNLLKRELQVERQCLTLSAGAAKPFLTDHLKTRASRRRVPLPQFVVDALDAHLQAQECGPDGALFVSSRGNLWRRTAFNDVVWKPSLEAAGLDRRYGFHALRHTYASGLIAQNIHPRVIQARLGHASITETMDTYGHLFPDSDEATSSALDDIFGPASTSLSEPGPDDPASPGKLRIVP